MAHRITLRGGLVALVDEADAALCAGISWRPNYAYENGKRVRLGAVYSGAGHSRRALHRVIMEAGDGDVVDHIDGDPLNNTRANLRVCSHAENMRNRRIHRNNQCGIKGVWSEPRSDGGFRWRACIRLDGKSRHLGSFDTKEEAANAYASAAPSFHGEFARIA